ncbi:hypothetical protein CEUSTIGMA_g9324.t1 [Chlamydomonas eustigma]|uniref:Uncharacterized protein n=1 Tax=Chlamydomonas eustigma TaxID=1157962 RepID=A0A250XFU0_9CHLO|nr:hypothetical protein CEUSTIGMA_g9324.t1 [Chlamydomonas eustigma]|eukprot:GAX81896.1 hypothetical protein CEUSTIGMA_g9324.t1 [Chlamydomonas eustigma]
MDSPYGRNSRGGFRSPSLASPNKGRSRMKSPWDTEGDDATMTHEQQLAMKDHEINSLKRQLNGETRRIGMLESEIKLCVAAAQKAEAAHAEELARAESDVKRVLAERRTLVQRFQLIEVVEDAVRELYMQMKDRTADGGIPTPEQLQAEKAALKEENILVVLGSLHAMLKGLWSFKVEAEADLRGMRIGRELRAEENSVALRDRIRSLDAEVRVVRQEASTAQLRYEMEAESRMSLMEEAQASVAAMEAQQQEVLGALRSSEKESAALRSALEAALEEGKRRDGLIMVNRQLESARHFDRAQLDMELKRLQVEHNKQLGSIEKELGKLNTVMIANERLKSQLDKAIAQAASDKRALRFLSRSELLLQVQNLQEELAASSRRQQHNQGIVGNGLGSGIIINKNRVSSSGVAAAATTLNPNDLSAQATLPPASTAMHQDSSSMMLATVLPSGRTSMLQVPAADSGAATFSLAGNIPFKGLTFNSSVPKNSHQRAAMFQGFVTSSQGPAYWTDDGTNGGYTAAAAGRTRPQTAGPATSGGGALSKSAASSATYTAGGIDSNSLASKARAIMEELQSKARSVAIKAAAEKVDDPIYDLIANVGVLNKQVKSAFRAVWSEIDEPPSNLTAKDQAGHPSATASMVQSASRMSQQRGEVGMVGSTRAGPADVVLLRPGSTSSRTATTGKRNAQQHASPSSTHHNTSTSTAVGVVHPVVASAHNPHLSRETGLSKGRFHQSSSSSSAHHTAEASLQIIKAAMDAGMSPIPAAGSAASHGLALGNNNLNNPGMSQTSDSSQARLLGSAKGRLSSSVKLSTAAGASQTQGTTSNSGTSKGNNSSKNNVASSLLGFLCQEKHVEVTKAVRGPMDMMSNPLVAAYCSVNLTTRRTQGMDDILANVKESKGVY